MKTAKGGGYYSVLVGGTDGEPKASYIVFADSDWHAARIVRNETGYMAHQQDVEGPR